MTPELRIACSLTANQLAGRLAEMADLGRAALIHAHRDGARAELRFAAGIGTRERLDRIVAAESQCCAFLAMRVTEHADELVLTIDAPEDAELVLAELVDAFASTAPAA